MGQIFLMIKGSATVAGTSSFRLQNEFMKFSKIPNLGIEASRLGLGTFRIPEHNAENLVSEAIKNGINVFDCAPNFQKGMSEILLGKGLKLAKQQELIDRSQYVLVGKGGFVPKGTPSFPNTYITNNIRYSIHPSYIEHQISKTMEYLGVDHLDVFLLSNPERIVHASGRSFQIDRCYEEIALAFAHLEIEQKRGRITTFGIASNSLALPDTPDHLKLEEILKLGPMGAIQYPLNIFEPDVLEGDCYLKSVDEICEENQLFRMTQRPFLAISTQGVLRLSPSRSDMTESETNNLATKQFTAVADLEHLIGGKSSND